MSESLVVNRQERGRPWAIRRVALACLIVVAGVWVYTFKAEMPDFEVYWRTGARAAHAEPLYRVTDGEYQFKYFPAPRCWRFLSAHCPTLSRESSGLAHCWGHSSRFSD